MKRKERKKSGLTLFTMLKSLEKAIVGKAGSLGERRGRDGGLVKIKAKKKGR